VSKHIFGKSRLFANSDDQRLKQLKHAVYASDSQDDMVRPGGYGGLRLVSHMESWRRPKRPKIFLGYSDITTLHAFFNQNGIGQHCTVRWWNALAEGH